jgi:anti-sigma-K factor RskA
MNSPKPSRSDALAAEYVLGTLHGAARRRFERLLPAHPHLQRAVADWEGRLNRLAAGGGPAIPPPPAVWTALETRLFPAPRREPWWNRLGFWRGLAVAGGVRGGAGPDPAPEPARGPGRGPRRDSRRRRDVLWTVARAEGGQLHVSNLRPVAVPPDQHCLLWLKTRDAPPILLGVLPDDGSVGTLVLPADLTMPARGELWVTMQPVTPSPSPPERRSIRRAGRRSEKPPGKTTTERPSILLSPVSSSGMGTARSFGCMATDATRPLSPLEQNPMIILRHSAVILALIFSLLAASVAWTATVP